MPHDIIDIREQKLADHISRLLDNAERDAVYEAVIALVTNHLKKPPV